MTTVTHINVWRVWPVFHLWWTLVPLAIAVASCAAPAPPGGHALAAMPQAHCHATGELPDASCTPGAVETTDLAIICHQSTRERRNVPASVKRAVLEAYGMSREADGDLEIDHFLPLCLGGSNSERNLWPELAPAFHEKDRVELRAHDEVCAGRLDIGEAQRGMMRDWRALGRRLGL